MGSKERTKNIAHPSEQLCTNQFRHTGQQQKYVNSYRDGGSEEGLLPRDSMTSCL